MISGDQEFSTLNALMTVLPTAPSLDWMAASQHCGLIKRNICFLEERLFLLHHSLLFTTVLGIMVVHMELHIIKFVNGFPCRGGVEHFSPGEIMTGCHLHNVVPMEITFMDTEDEYKQYGTLRSLRYMYSNPFRFLISSLGLPNFPSQKI
jgi:hypothetical protein